MSRKLYFEAIRALPEKWVANNTAISVFTAERFEKKIVAANPDFAPMEYVNGKWRDIEVSAPQAEVEAEKTLRFLKTGRQHD